MLTITAKYGTQLTFEENKVTVQENYNVVEINVDIQFWEDIWRSTTFDMPKTFKWDFERPTYGVGFENDLMLQNQLSIIFFRDGENILKIFKEKESREIANYAKSLLEKRNANRKKSSRKSRAIVESF